MLKLNNAVTTRVSNGKIKVTASLKPNSPRTLASHGSRELANYGVGGGGIGGSNSVSMSTIGGSQRNNMDLTLMGLLDDSQDSLLHKYYRDIYYYDSVAGSAVDLQSSLPFSDFDLVGVEQKQLETYNSAIARLNFKTTNRFISANYLVYGAFVGTNVYNKQHKIFTDMLPYDIEDCTFQYNPFASMPPMITVKPNKELQNFLTSDEPVIRDLRKQIPQTLLSAMSNGDFVLDPLTTLFLVRKGMESSRPVSYYRRLLPIYLLEKTLLRGTLVEAGKRQRSLLHVQCLAGDTLISTNSGLLRLDSIVEHDIEDAPFSVETNIKVRSFDNNFYTAKAWHYRGQKETIKLKLASGKTLTCTPDHKIQILNEVGELVWVEAKDTLNKNTCTLIAKKSYGSEKLKLNKYVHHANYGNKIYKDALPPKKMTEDLAYILGCLSGDGSVRRNGIEFRTTDIKCADGFKKKFDSVFGVDSTVTYKEVFGYYIVSCYSVAIARYLEELGLYVIKKNNRNRSHSHYRKVPHTILVAHAKAKTAFVAGMLDTDGHVSATNKGVELRFYSVSKKLLAHLQLILAELGCYSLLAKDSSYDNKYYLHISLGNSSKIYPSLLNYLCDSRRIKRVNLKNSINGFGMPTTPFIKALDSLKTTEPPANVKKTNGRIYLRNESGESVETKYPYGTTIDKIKKRKTLPFSDETKLLSQFMEIAKVNKNIYENMNIIKNANYKFDEVISIEPSGIKAVYDLSMENGCRNSFAANSIIVHNCGDDQWEATPEELQALVSLFQQADLDPLGPIIATRNGIQASEARQGGDFWKYTDVIDITNGLKLRALGISDTFLSGETSFATAEVALSVFIENLKAYRDYYTQVVFYDKLFPVIAAVNGYINKHSTQSLQDLKSKDVGVAVKDSSSYAIPQVRWHKSLEPNNDRDTFEMLQNLSQLGFPVTLRMLAASAGLRVENILNELDEDLDIRKKFSDYNKKVQEASGEGGEGGEDDGGDYDDYGDFEGSSAMGAYSRLKLQNPFKRNFENANEVIGKTKTGKPKYIMNQRLAQQKENELIAKASLSMKDPNRRAAVSQARKLAQRKK